MRIRGSHIVIAVIAAMVGFVLLAVFRDTSLRHRGDSEKDFLEEIHQLQENVSPLEGLGQLPPVGGDQSLVPSLEIDPRNLDVGPVSNKSKSTFEIKVYNRGKTPLHVSSVQTNCACTLAEMDRDHIPPGKVGILTVAFNPFRVFGFVSKKMLTLYTNDPKNSAVDVKVNVTIEPEFSLEPMDLDFGEIDKGTPAQRTMVLRQLTDEPIEVNKIETLGDLAMVDFAFSKRPQAEWAQPDRPEFLIQATLAQDLIPGEHDQLFKIHVVCKRFPFLTCKAHATLNAFYSVVPKKLIIAKSISDDFATATITADRAFELVDVQALGPNLDVSTKPGPEPNAFLIRPQLAPGAEPGEQTSAIRFTVKTEQQAFANRIPVHYTMVQVTRDATE